jgi:hypothetical protein
MFRLSGHAVLLAAACAAALAGEPAAAPAKVEAPAASKVEPELAPDKELLAKLEALPDNTWLKLPPFTVVGDLGELLKDFRPTGPRVRDYCNKMVWAPERKRALYCGGGHGYPPFNDVWEYDLAANTWICLYGPDPVPPRTKPGEEDQAVAWYKEHAVLKNGSVRTLRGAPLRPCHTWWSLCYDTDRRQMLFMESHKGFFGVDKVSLAKALNMDPKDPLFQTYGSGPGDAWLFAFDPAKREWQDVVTGVPKAGESLCLEYLPDSKLIWWLSDKTYRRGAAANEWVAYPGSANGSAVFGGMTAYDPETRQIVGTAGLKTWVFKCDEGKWSLAQPDAMDGCYVPLGTFCYDTTAKRFVLYTHMKRKDGTAEPRLRLYDHRENKWSDPAPQGELPKIGNVAGYYDPERNVTVFYGDRERWVYRCKRAGK